MREREVNVNLAGSNPAHAGLNPAAPANKKHPRGGLTLIGKGAVLKTAARRARLRVRVPHPPPIFNKGKRRLNGHGTAPLKQRV